MDGHYPTHSASQGGKKPEKEKAPKPEPEVIRLRNLFKGIGKTKRDSEPGFDMVSSASTRSGIPLVPHIVEKHENEATGCAGVAARPQENHQIVSSGRVDDDIEGRAPRLSTIHESFDETEEDILDFMSDSDDFAEFGPPTDIDIAIKCSSATKSDDRPDSINGVTVQDFITGIPQGRIHTIYRAGIYAQIARRNRSGQHNFPAHLLAQRRPGTARRLRKWLRAVLSQKK